MKIFSTILFFVTTSSLFVQAQTVGFCQDRANALLGVQAEYFGGGTISEDEKRVGIKKNEVYKIFRQQGNTCVVYSTNLEDKCVIKSMVGCQ